MNARLLAVAGLILGGIGCSAITGNGIERERRLGSIRFHNDPVVVEIPSSVARGTDFEITVRTYGDGCVEQGDTEVTLTATEAEVRPFDVAVNRFSNRYVCTDVLNRFYHRAILRFGEAGVGTIRVRGREEPRGREIVVERLILVR